MRPSGGLQDRKYTTTTSYYCYRRSGLPPHFYLPLGAGACDTHLCCDSGDSSALHSPAHLQRKRGRGAGFNADKRLGAMRAHGTSQPTCRGCKGRRVGARRSAGKGQG